jgi:hypothetical protein
MVDTGTLFFITSNFRLYPKLFDKKTEKYDAYQALSAIFFLFYKN